MTVEERVRKVYDSIKEEHYDFDREEFLEYTKFQLKNIYKKICSNSIDEIRDECSNLNIDDILKQKSKYRISDKIDVISIQYVELLNYVKEENTIDIYASVYFYDDTENNNVNQQEEDNYWNDIWIITYKYSKENLICKRCGASLEYDKKSKVLTCNYCRNSIPFNLEFEWTPIKITVE